MGKYKVDCDPLMLECREGSMLPITYRLHKTSTDTYAECSVSLDPSDADDLAIWRPSSRRPRPPRRRGSPRCRAAWSPG